ncbi:hypothetical protein M404DRAFT_726965 [Pisolithus tinctorius Marx 270]|uniref:Uncharacterized protein n=1 Tax=Pisolithus tinctorius Marx 270 TaxID=870435 RepID=A0A0C3IXG4_PISTI|nr:hypothetical protein M404DRAFT_726965 [Pisolithus tinctorius Marx 270]
MTMLLRVGGMGSDEMDYRLGRVVQGQLRRVRRIPLELRQQPSRIREDTRCARSTEATPRGLDGPRFSFCLDAYYPQLRRSREYEVPSYETSTLLCAQQHRRPPRQALPFFPASRGYAVDNRHPDSCV